MDKNRLDLTALGHVGGNARTKKLPTDLPDVQSWPDNRNITIDRAGIQGLLYPIMIRRKGLAPLQSIASFDIQCRLDKSVKGVNMSRFIDILHERYEGLILTAESLDSLLQLICERLDSTAVFLKVSLPFFIEKLAPSSNSPGLVSYHVDIVASCSKDTTYQVMAVSAPIMSACPSSIQLAQINSHNQRSFVRATINHCQHVFVEDVIAVIESSASASLYSSVKRVDELHLTRLAFTRPKFVEDVVRDVVVQLNILGMEWYSVDSCHVESIHNHQAYAKIIQPDIAIPIRELLAEL